MSAAAVFTLPVVRSPASGVRPGQPDTDKDALSAFPDLLSKMAGTGAEAGGERPEALPDRQNVLERAMSRLVVAQGVNGEGAALEPAIPPLEGSATDGSALEGSVVDEDGRMTADRGAASAGQDGPPMASGPCVQGIPPGLANLVAEHAAKPGNGEWSSPTPTAEAASAVPDRDLRVRLGSHEPATATPSTAPASPNDANEAVEALPPARASVQPRGSAVGGEVTPNLTVAVIGRETHISPALRRLPDPPVADEADNGADTAPVTATAETDRDAVTAEATPLQRPLAPNGQRPTAQPGGFSSSPAFSAGQRLGHEGENFGHATAATDAASVTAGPDQPHVSTTAPSPMQQVAGRIAAAVHSMQSEAAQTASAVPAKVPSSPVVKVLKLELQPADLGTITIRMSLKQDGLDVRVEAGRPETARMLQTDQEVLSKVLSNAGYRIEHMSVVAASFDGTVGADGRGQPFPGSPGSQQGWSQEANARSSGGRQHAEPDRRTYRGRQNDETEKNSTVPSAGGHLYV